MLAFYPEFEAESITENEIILMLDLSNSMKVIYLIPCHCIDHIDAIVIQDDALESAKKVCLLLLHHLPPKTLFNIITFGASQYLSNY